MKKLFRKLLLTSGIIAPTLAAITAVSASSAQGRWVKKENENIETFALSIGDLDKIILEKNKEEFLEYLEQSSFSQMENDVLIRKFEFLKSYMMNILTARDIFINELKQRNINFCINSTIKEMINNSKIQDEEFLAFNNNTKANRALSDIEALKTNLWNTWSSKMNLRAPLSTKENIIYNILSMVDTFYDNKEFREIAYKNIPFITSSAFVSQSNLIKDYIILFEIISLFKGDTNTIKIILENINEYNKEFYNEYERV